MMDEITALMSKTSGWIWTDDYDAADAAAPKLVYFRKVIDLDPQPEVLRVRVSADTRYRFYVNGNFVEAGPQKGDHENWYYDTVDLAPRLKKGKNVLAACVLRYPEDPGKGNFSMIRTNMPGFYLEEENGQFAADSTWKVKKRETCEITAEHPFFSPLWIYERAQGDEECDYWKEPEFDDSGWKNAVPYPFLAVKRAVSPGNLYARTIPPMKRMPGRFSGVSALRESACTKEEWETFLQGESTICLPAGAHEVVEITSGEEMTAYLSLAVSGGRGSGCRLLYSECYYCSDDGKDRMFPGGKKGDRTDAENGVLIGQEDVYTVSGYGKSERPERYEPFWFRTFRFVRLDITVGEEPLVLEKLDYQETGYPLEVKTHVETSDPSLAAVWEISERTLKCCMHETYEDCPYYEQLQYAMDSRSQILYTYQVAADDRLARNCMNDMKNSVRHDGMINCCYPQTGPNVIPGFSIYYIGMVYDHMMYFDDPELIRDHLPVIDGILRFFERNLDDRGLVGPIGGLNVVGKYWSFIDWTPQWDATTGVPGKAHEAGPLTMESLLYVLGLMYAAELSDHIGRCGMAEEYRRRAASVKAAVNTYCRGRDGLYQDGPGVEAYSQHCQVFALLTETVDREEGRRLLEITLADREEYAPCSVAMAFYLFRAMELAGIYDRTERQWDVWREMVKNHCSTCVEDDVKARSDCHAWGALALYELPAAVLGVRPKAPGYREIQVSPVPGYLTWAKGKVITPRGMVSVSWKKKEDGSLDLQYTLPMEQKDGSARTERQK